MVHPLIERGQQIEADKAAATAAANVVPTGEELDFKIAQAIGSKKEEARLREEQAARPRSDGLVDNVTDMFTGEDADKSAWDLTIDALGVVTDPINDVWDAGRGLVGLEPAGRITDTLKDAVRETETGFKMEQGARQGARDIMMTPAIPSMVYGLTAAALESAVDDEEFAKSMLNEEGQALWDEWQNNDDGTAAQKLFDNMEAYQRPGVKFMSEWFESTTEVSGVEERQYGDTPVEEEVIGILMSSFIGVPSGMINSFGRRMVQQFGEEAVEKAMKMASTKTARVVTRVSEAATPLTLPLTPGNVAINTGAGIGINDTMRWASGMDTALGQSIDAVADIPVALAEQPDLPTDPNATAELPEAQPTMRPPPDPDAPLPIMQAGVGGAVEGLVDTVKEHPGGSIMTGAGLVTAGMATAAMLKRPDRMRRVITSRTGEPTPGRPTGELDPSIYRQAETELVDSEAPIAHILGDMADEVDTPLARARRDEALDNVRTQTRQGGDVRNDNAYHDGIKPISYGESYTNSGEAIQRVFDNDLSKAQRSVVTEAMVARDVQWSIRNGRGNPTGWNANVIQGKIDALDVHNPHLKKYADTYNVHTKEILGEAHKAGLLTSKQYNEMMTRPYVPNMKPVEAPSTSKKLGALFGTNRQFDNQVNNPFLKYRKGAKIDFADPIDSLRVYERAMTKDMLDNTARISVIRQFNGLKKMMSTDQLNKMFPEGNPIQRLKKKSDANNEGRIIEVKQGNGVQYWEVGDAHLYNALKLAPHSTLHTLSSLRRMSQIGTTGELAPGFALHTAPFIDGFFSAMMRGNHQVGGVLDKITGAHAARQSDNKLLRGVGQVAQVATAVPDVLGNIAIGTARGAIDNGVRAIAQSLNDGMLKSGLGQLLGPQMVKGASIKMSNVMNKTMTQQMRSQGFAPGRFSEDVGDMSAGAFDRAYKGLFNMPGLKQYRGVLETVRNSYRLEFFSQQFHKYKKQGFTDEAASKRAAREAREIGSDPSRAGQSKLFNQTTSTIPYSNVGVQATGTFARAMSDGRMPSIALNMVSHAAYMSGALGLLASVGGLGWWYNETPDRIRARGLPLPDPRKMTDIMSEGYEFDPDDFFMVDIGPEAAIQRAGVMAGIEYINGMSSPAQHSDERVQSHMAEFGEAAKMLWPFGIPTFANIGLAASGMGSVQPNRFSENRGLFKEPISGSGMQGNEREFNSNGGIMTDYVADIITSMAGSSGRTMADSVEQFEGHRAMNDSTFMEAMDSVFDRNAFNFEKKFAPGVFGASRSPTKSSPTIQKAYELRSTMEPILDQVEINTYGAKKSFVLETVGDVSDGVMELSNQVQDRNIKIMLEQVAYMWEKDPFLNEQYKTLRNASDKYKALGANRGMSRAQQSFLQDGQVMRMQQASKGVVDTWDKTEKMLESTLGRYGYTNMTDLFKAAQKDLDAQAR